MRDTKWMVYSKRADFGAISARFSVSPMLARILINRDIAEDDIATYLDGTLDSVPSGDLLPDMARSVEILAEKIRARKLIRIIGDYDIDGVCSTYILLQGMRALGANADYDIPDRIADGYGLNLRQRHCGAERSCGSRGAGAHGHRDRSPRGGARRRR